MMPQSSLKNHNLKSRNLKEHHFKIYLCLWKLSLENERLDSHLHRFNYFNCPSQYLFLEAIRPQHWFSLDQQSCGVTFNDFAIHILQVFSAELNTGQH